MKPKDTVAVTVPTALAADHNAVFQAFGADSTFIIAILGGAAQHVSWGSSTLAPCLAQMFGCGWI